MMILWRRRRHIFLALRDEFRRLRQRGRWREGVPLLLLDLELRGLGCRGGSWRMESVVGKLKVPTHELILQPLQLFVRKAGHGGLSLRDVNVIWDVTDVPLPKLGFGDEMRLADILALLVRANKMRLVDISLEWGGLALWLSLSLLARPQ